MYVNRFTPQSTVPSFFAAGAHSLDTRRRGSGEAQWTGLGQRSTACSCAPQRTAISRCSCRCTAGGNRACSQQKQSKSDLFWKAQLRGRRFKHSFKASPARSSSAGSRSTSRGSPVQGVGGRASPVLVQGGRDGGGGRSPRAGTLGITLREKEVLYSPGR